MVQDEYPGNCKRYSLNKIKRPFKRSSIFFILLATLFLTACGAQGNDQNWPGLFSDGETVYFSYGPGVAAYDAIEQQELWRFNTENGQLNFYAPPSVVDDRIILGDYGAAGSFLSPQIIVTIYGQEDRGQSAPQTDWANSEIAADKIVAGPLQVGDIAYVASADFNLYALEVETGEVIWVFPTNGAIWGQPTYHDGIIYITSLDKNVYALDVENGEVIWQEELGGAISAKPLLNIDENLLYVGAYDNVMHALDADTGAEKWTFTATNWIWNAPALANGVLYFADSSGQVFSVDAASGEEIWTTSIDEMHEVEGNLLPAPERIEGAIQASPVYFDGILYVASEGNRISEEGLLVALDAETGEEIWQQTTSQPLYATPVIADDAIIVAMNAEAVTMTAYSLDSGDQMWSYLPVQE